MLFLLGGILISCTGNGELLADNTSPSDTLSFELASDDEADWDGSSGGIRSDGFYAPPDGKSYAYQED